MGEPPDDGGRLRRRRLLATLAGAAGLGGVTGAGTRALLSARTAVPDSVLDAPYTGSHLDLDVTCSAQNCTADKGTVTFDFTDIDPPAAGSTELCLGVDGTPAWLWLRSSPPVPERLAEVLTVTLSYADGTPVAAGGTPVTDWALNDVLSAFDGGERLAGGGPDGAVPAGQSRCLTLDWTLPDVADIAGDSVELALTFAAIQYRTGASPSNPWTNGA